jgi:hypothetical protein
MKLAYANWHKEPVQDDMIKTELAHITGGALQYEPAGGFKVTMDMRPNGSNSFGKNKKNKQGGNRNFSAGGNAGGNFNKNRKYKNKNKGGGIM